MELAVISTGGISVRDRELLKCRAYGHRWIDRGWVAMIKDAIRGWEQELSCDRCETVRSDFRARGSMRLLGRSYRYKHDDYPGMVKQKSALRDLVEHDTRRKPAPIEGRPAS